MAAEQPVIVHPYGPAMWDEVYRQHLHMIEDPVCFSSRGSSWCPRANGWTINYDILK